MIVSLFSLLATTPTLWATTPIAPRGAAPLLQFVAFITLVLSSVTVALAAPALDGVHPFEYCPTQANTDLETRPDLPGEFYLEPVYPPSRILHCAVSCGSGTDQDCMLMFGGQQYEVGSLMDMWEFSVSKREWKLVNVQGFDLGASSTISDWAYKPGQKSGQSTFPGSRVGHRCSPLSGIEGTNSRFRMIAGRGIAVGSSSTHWLNDVWDFDLVTREWTFRSIAPGCETWTDVGDSVTGDVLHPASRYLSQQWGFGDDTILVGGRGVTDPLGHYFWRFVDSLGQWRLLAVAGPIPPPDDYYDLYGSATWKDSLSVLFQFGGRNRMTGVFSNGLFSLNVSSLEWTNLNSTYSIPLLERYVIVGDSYLSQAGKQIALVAGGRYGASLGMVLYLADAWAFLADTGWSQVHLTSTHEEDDLVPHPGAPGRYFPPSNAYPSARAAQSLVIVGSTAVLYGGVHDEGFTGPGSRALSDVWMIPHLECLLGREIEPTESHLCSGHGTCFDDAGGCICEDSYSGTNCTESCDSSVECSGHGLCVSAAPVICKCDIGYLGTSCSDYGCNGIPHDAPGVCSGHGECVREAEAILCLCDELYGGTACERYDCRNTDSGLVCGAYGECSFDGTHCECLLGYSDSATGVCDQWQCFGIWWSDDQVCSSRGSCVAPGVCDCGASSFGSECRTLVSIVVGTVVGFGLMAACVCLLIVALVGVLVFFLTKNTRALKQKTHVLDGLKFQLLEDGDSEMGEVKVDPSLFIVDPDDLVLERRLGRGASASVFLASWKSMDVAVKTFRLDDIDGSIFEKEIQIMSVVNHHGAIVRFFGAALMAPRCCLVLEYCSQGDLKAFLERHPTTPLRVRLRIGCDIASGLAFLHSLDIIHRDLKPSNVFVTEDGGIRIGDFGLSRVDSLTSSHTCAIGTHHFMAPELTLGLAYDSSVDIFAFGILLFEILVQDFRNPYARAGVESVADGLLHFRVASDPSFRPDLSRIRGRYGGDGDVSEQEDLCWISELLPHLWDADGSSRPTAEQALQLFSGHL